jgi:hypothetical protein
VNTGINILRLCPQLEECRFWFQPTHIPLTSGITVHSRLRRLQIGPTEIGPFFSRVTLPSLVDLVLDGESSKSWIFGTLIYTSAWDQPAIAAFFIRSQCSLENLAFSHIDISTEDLTTCLEIVSPTLTSLAVEGGRDGLIEKTLLKRLAYQASNNATNAPAPVLCPRLEVIRFYGGIVEQEGYGSDMIGMLESRFHGSIPGSALIPLKSACISGAFGPRQLERVKQLREEGLALTFTQEGKRFL